MFPPCESQALITQTFPSPSHANGMNPACHNSQIGRRPGWTAVCVLPKVNVPALRITSAHYPNISISLPRKWNEPRLPQFPDRKGAWMDCSWCAPKGKCSRLANHKRSFPKHFHLPPTQME